MRDIKANLLHLLIMRWLTLVNIVLLFSFKTRPESPYVFTFAVLYCLLLTLFWRKLTKLLNRYFALLALDITISGILMGLSGGSWASPYFLYALTSILIASYYSSSIKVAFLSTGYFSILYILGIVFNDQTVATIIKLNDFDILGSGYLALFLLTIFFGFPAHVIRKIEQAQNEAAQAEAELRQAEELITVVTTTNLSCRELEVLSSLSTGKTNLQIAQELFISEKTVKNHLYKIYKKLGVSSREEAILYFHASRTSEE